MKLKEILRTANQAWSSSLQHPVYLATGTSAQQLDASFSTTSALEIFELDFSDPSLDMKPRGSLSITNRFHSLIWVNYDMDKAEAPGLLIGGGDNGVVTVYNPSKILATEKDTIVGQCEKHKGPVRALDFNPFQNNLLASGANDSEIYIWDLNNFCNPMTPGAKSQPYEDVSVVAWNRQVQHILASAHPSGKAVVWDLRKNEPIIKISDHSNKMHCSGMLWHPEVATQLVLASEDDRLPVIQIWDLRFATSPLKVLENHTRGILSISWSNADPELLLSSAKDNRILCWNPNTGEVIYELPTSSQWCFDVQWCPRNPAILSAASFDGRISIYSVMGGCLMAQEQSSSDKISSSFSTTDHLGTGLSLPPLQIPQKVTHSTVIPPLKKPPKWIRRPVGAVFAFGGKLITFENPKVLQHQQAQTSVPHHVCISQITTETEFLQQASDLQTALRTGSFSSFCQGKIHSATTDSEQSVWSFLKVNFEDNPRTKFLKLLGYSREELDKKISMCLGKSLHLTSHGIDANDLAEKIQVLSAQQLDESSSTGDTLSSPASSSPSDFYGSFPNDKTKFQIPITSDTDGLISQALLIGNFEGAVELCLNDGRYADAIILAISGGEELLRKTQKRYLAKQKNSISMLMSTVVNQNWTDIVQLCDLQNWKEALAALLTYARPDEFSKLCDTLGSRLEFEGENSMCLEACLCYICSGNVEKLVECWVQKQECLSPLALEGVVEMMTILRKSIEKLQGSDVPFQGPVLAEKLTQYAHLLAAQGNLAAALTFLPTDSSLISIMQLRDRLFYAQGEAVAGQQPPPFPYNRINVTAVKQPVDSTQNTNPKTNMPPTPISLVPATSQPSHPKGFSQQSVQSPVVQTFPPVGIPAASQRAPSGMYIKPTACPMYPQPSMSASGLPQPPPFSQPRDFPSGQPTIPAQHPLMPSAVPAAPSGSLIGLPSSSLSGPSFIPPSSLPSYQLSGPTFHSSQLPCTQPVFPGSIHTPASMAASEPSVTYPVGPGFPYGGPGAPAASPLVPATLPPPPTGYFPWLQNRDEEGSQDGWNDPPSVHGVTRKKKLPENYTPPMPITAPVMNPSVEHQPLQPNTSLPRESQAPPGAPKESNIQPLFQLPSEKIERKDIPQEHILLQTSFDSLVQRCLLAAGDPQTKRKLDDASKRLEFLYDKLREQSLSPNILGGLHEIRRCIEVRNYQQALLVHTQVVSSNNFSEISAFMPVLKVVMTIANKLAV
ncbi:protein transport protein Sec31A isoform X2 [Polypterus senegalus]|uniref:protein transport protein Sec31A isoform X2 n=1 Tax=Polypterus senegalus TaxID=55291 RepID=UPI0019622C09|nr:protein transport protein Sec31A isoform X2 [Polypterus senegalus]